MIRKTSFLLRPCPLKYPVNKWGCRRRWNNPAKSTEEEAGYNRSFIE
jgi:hypothetical protein